MMRDNEGFCLGKSNTRGRMHTDCSFAAPVKTDNVSRALTADETRANTPPYAPPPLRYAYLLLLLLFCLLWAGFFVNNKSVPNVNQVLYNDTLHSTHSHKSSSQRERGVHDSAPSPLGTTTTTTTTTCSICEELENDVLLCWGARCSSSFLF